VGRIEPIAVEQAEGWARELLDELVERGGEPGPMVRAMANAPALLRGYLDLTRAMKRSHIDRRITERINLAVHEWLGCDYCLVAHTRAARKLGVPDNEILLARHGSAARKMGIPLGPFLALGSIVALFAGDALLDAYLGLLAP
jgi:AhpD family alkylhydroperoxidase